MLGLLALMSIFISTQAIGSDALEERPGVILLHGLGRTNQSMAEMARALEAAGFTTANMDYPSREYPIEKLALEVIPRGLRRCHARGARRIHFVTHSLGGILVRYYLSQRRIQGLGRVVMLSPPNKGSEAADVLQDMAFYQWFNGPAGQQLGTGPGSFVIQLGPVNYPVGVITGNTHALFDTWLADLIPGPDDGKVSVERAKVEGMTDFLSLPYAHPFIMEEPEVIDQTIHFLRQGRFKHQGSPVTDDLKYSSWTGGYYRYVQYRITPPAKGGACEKRTFQLCQQSGAATGRPPGSTRRFRREGLGCFRPLFYVQ